MKLNRKQKSCYIEALTIEVNGGHSKPVYYLSCKAVFKA